MVRGKARDDYWRFKKGVLYMFSLIFATAYQMNKSGVARGATFKILCYLIVFLLFVIVKKHFNHNLNFIHEIHNNKIFNRIKDRKLFS